MVQGFGRTLAAPDEPGRRGPGVLFGWALMAVGWVGWLGGRVLQASVSRQREFLADASAVKYTRLVDGIGGALRKIAGQASAGPASRHPASLSHLWLAAPPAAAAPAWRRWLATHPPLAERLRRLYGRPMPALAAEVLPVPGDEPASHEAVPVATRAGLVPPWPLARERHDALAQAPAPSEAARFDATQHADRGSAAERETEALQRIGFWHSRGERHAALLALLIADDGARAPWPAWRAATAAWPVADAVRNEVLALGPAARLRTLETLGRRTADAGDGRALWHASGILATTDAARLRRWVLRRCLWPPRPPRVAPARTLDAMAPEAAAAMALLAPLLGLPVPSVHRYRSRRSTVHRALPLRHLHPMQRPRLVRRWLQATEAAGRLGDAGALASLALACRLLDSPVPPAVSDRLQAGGATTADGTRRG
jgi:hypothetical protein